MREVDIDKTWIGFALGLITPALAFLIYYFINYNFMTRGEFIQYLRLGNTYTPLLSMCVLANLAIFYPFLWKEKWKGAKGVLAATFVWAGLIVYLKFFT